MAKLVEMDEKITLSQQMEEKNIGPVILINKFNVKPDDVDEFPRAWAAEAEIMKRQPGFISTQLHRGIAGSCVFINYAVWESTEHYKRAFNNPEFQSMLAKTSGQYNGISSSLQESCGSRDLCGIILHLKF